MPTIAQHAAQHGIIPLKKYGQNFIFDATLCDKMVRCSNLSKGEMVLEIGPGTAGLTRSILNTEPESLIVVETDVRCIPLLEEIAARYSALKIIHADALTFELADLTHKKINIISNLPYQIGTELVLKWLKQAGLINSMTLMLQKEVVGRMKAQPSSAPYGVLSIMCQLICTVEKCFDVRRQAFYPSPTVESSVVKLTPLPEIPDKELINIVESVTKTAFSKRRKMLKSSLKDFAAGYCPSIEELLKTLHIDATMRAENISPAQYLALAKLIYSAAREE